MIKKAIPILGIVFGLYMMASGLYVLIEPLFQEKRVPAPGEMFPLQPSLDGMIISVVGVILGIVLLRYSLRVRKRAQNNEHDASRKCR